MVDIASVVYWALAMDPRRKGEAPMEPAAMRAAVRRLFALLRERRLPYLLVGGLAMLQYVEGRNTQDVDLILALPEAARLPGLVLSEQDPDFATGSFEGLPVHLLLTRNSLFAGVQQCHATECEFAGERIRCATVEGLIVLKLYALPSLYRQGDFARVNLYEGDIAALVQRYDPPLEPLLAELDEHLSETDLAALREVLADIRGRLERFRRTSGKEGGGG